MKKLIIMAAVCASMPAASTYAGDAPEAASRFQLELRGWDTKLDLQVDTITDLTGRTLDLDDTFDIGDETLPEIRFTYNSSKKNSFYIYYTRIEYDSDVNVEEDFIIDDQLATAMADVSSNIEIDAVRLGWRRSLFIDSFHKEDGRKFFDVELILEAMVFDISTDFAAVATVASGGVLVGDETAKEGFDVTVPVPAIGVSLSYTPIKHLTLFVQATGLDIGIASLIDAEGGIRVHVIDHVDIVAGYRILDLRGEDGDDEAQFKISGAFAGLGYNF